MDAQRFRARKFDTLNARAAREPRNILGIGTALDAFTQIVGNVLRNRLIGHHATFSLAREPDDMEAVAGRHRLRAKLAGCERTSARSNSGVVCPVVIWPRLPPSSAEEHFEWAFASAAKELGS